MTMKEENQVNFTWDYVEVACAALYMVLKPLKPKLVVGVARGGLIPAVRLSHRLGIPLVSVEASSYTNKRKTLLVPEIHFDKMTKEKIDKAGDNCIIVDDIVDTGATSDALRKHFPNALQVALVSKIANTPVSYHAYVDRKTWVNFPWEM